MNSGGGFTLEDGDILLALGKPEDIRKLKGEERETAGQGFGSGNKRYPSTEKLIEKNSHAKGKIPSRTRMSRTEYMIMVLSLSGVFGHGGKRYGPERKRIRIQSQNHPGE
jgi:hypothetical protein